MQRAEIVSVLQEYISQQVLDGRDVGLDAETPLLEWGIINSFEIVRLINFIQTRFGIQVPGELVLADNFKNIAAIADLLATLEEKPTHSQP